MKKFKVFVQYGDLKGYVIVNAISIQKAIKYVFEQCDPTSGITWTECDAGLDILSAKEIL